MPQSGIFDAFTSITQNKRETRFLYHYSDICLSTNIDFVSFLMI